MRAETPYIFVFVWGLLVLASFCGIGALLARALRAHYGGDDAPLERYSDQALDRVWKAERFSWQLSMLMHQFPDMSEFEKRMQRTEFAYLAGSEAASRSIAENYVGLPFD